MPESVYRTKSNSAVGRLIILGAILAALMIAWFGVRWQIANMLGELTPASQVNAMEVAQAAISLSSKDPLPRRLLAAKQKEDFGAENIDASAANFEETVRLSPYDFRWWIELGRAHEQAERPAEAERAFKRAVELAPEYTFPQWQIGNFYLRQDRSDEAFAFLTKATEKSYVYREQVFALAWDYFDKDPARVEEVAADTPETRVTLAGFYAQRGAAADSLRVWNSVPADIRARHEFVLTGITELLYSKRRYRETVEFARQAGIDPDAQAEAVSNGGFEKFFGDVEGSLFGWRVNRGDSKLEILPDSSVRFDGERSLKLSFKGYNRPELNNVSQLVAVQPSARYRLTFMVRVENLRTGGVPLVAVVNANTDAPLGISPRFPLGSHDWHMMTIEFSVPEEIDGIMIRTVRENCGEICPINGIVWYDAFKLERL